MVTIFIIFQKIATASNHYLISIYISALIKCEMQQNFRIDIIYYLKLLLQDLHIFNSRIIKRYLKHVGHRILQSMRHIYLI